MKRFLKIQICIFADLYFPPIIQIFIFGFFKIQICIIGFLKIQICGKLKFRIRSIQDQLFLLITFLFLEIFKFCLRYKVLQILLHFVTLLDFYDNFLVVYGTGFSRDCYVYFGKLILNS
jgi:hypothetical protein